MKNKNIALFITNDFVTTLGNSIFSILIMWYVYEVTGAAIATAIIGSFAHISGFFAGPIAGVYADRSAKPLSILRWALRINGVIVLLMVVSIYLFHNNIEIWAIFILVALRELTFSLENPTQTRVMPLLVPVASLSKLVGFRSVSSNIADLLGNATSGFLIASIGILGGFVFNSITFFIGSFLIGFFHLLSPEERNVPSSMEVEEKALATTQNTFKQDMVEGFTYLWQHEYIKKITIIACLANMTSMIMPMFVVYFNDYLSTTAEAYGIFNAVLTVGSILSGLIIGRISRTLKNATIVLLGWFFLAIILLCMYFSVSIWLTYLFGFLLGIGLTLPSITLSTVQVLIVPDQYRGRVHTIMQAIGVVLIPLSNLIGGVIADSLGANYVFLIAGLWQLIVVLIVFLNRHTLNTQTI